VRIVPFFRVASPSSPSTKPRLRFALPPRADIVERVFSTPVRRSGNDYRSAQREQRLIVMRAVIALIVIVYLVGVGVVLSPVFQTEWNSGSASNLAASIGQALPNALAWPVGVYHSMTDHG
jgi:hypothetical protein